MIIKSQWHTIWVKILVIFVIQVSFLPRNCSSQFHWGRIYQLEIKQLRDMFSQATIQNDVAPNPIVVKAVSPFKIKGKRCILSCHIINKVLWICLNCFSILKNQAVPLSTYTGVGTSTDDENKKEKFDDLIRSLISRSPLTPLLLGQIYVQSGNDKKMAINMPFRKVLKCTVLRAMFRKCSWEIATMPIPE